MSTARKLLQKAINNPKNLRFSELCTLCSQFGMEKRSQEGSHHIYSHELGFMLSIQPGKDGSAKPYQIKQLIAFLEEYGLISGKENT